MEIKFTKREEEGLHCSFCGERNKYKLYETSPVKGIVCHSCKDHLSSYTEQKIEKIISPDACINLKKVENKPLNLDLRHIGMKVKVIGNHYFAGNIGVIDSFSKNSQGDNGAFIKFGAISDDKKYWVHSNEYEEIKQTLSDKLKGGEYNPYYDKKDVKETLKEFIDCFNKCASGVISKGYAYDRIKEIFGSDLIG